MFTNTYRKMWSFNTTSIQFQKENLRAASNAHSLHEGTRAPGPYKQCATPPRRRRQVSRATP
jgi:hypothetical protein